MAEDVTDTTGKTPLPAYIAFKTLMDLVERMEREGHPTRVDSTYLDSYAGGYRPTVISNLQTLGLLKKSGEPTETMLALVGADGPGRQRLIGELIDLHYADVLSLGKNSTQGQFLEMFEARGLRGDTRRKAVSFFLKACTYAGVPTGTHWKTPPASATGTRRRPRLVRRSDPEPPNGSNRGGDANNPDDALDVATVRLRSGGTLTLALAGSSLTMPRDDRNFVFGIVDLMQEYEQHPAGSAPPIKIDGSEANKPDTD